MITESSWGSLPPRSFVIVALLLHILPFVTRPALVGGDEPHYALAAYSLATDFDLDLDDDYEEVSRGSRAPAGKKMAGSDLDHHLVWVNGRQVFAHPIGLPMLVVPLVAALHAVAPEAAPDLPLGLLSLGVTFAALIAGWRLLREPAGGEAAASWLVFVVYFCSPLWFYSRTFFTEPYTWSFAILAVSALSRRHFVLAVFLLALTLAMKETALLLVIPILLGSFVFQGVRAAATVAMGPAVFGLLFMAKNWWLTGRLISTFQPFQYGDLLSGASGLLFDPAHGLVWFAPVLAVAMAGWVLPSRNGRQAWLGVCCLLAFLAYFLLTAAWVDWRGGSGYATRLILPALPALAIPLLRLSRALPRKISMLLLGTLASLGFAVNFCAAIDPVPAFWGASAFELVAQRPIVFLGALVSSAIVLNSLQRRSELPDSTVASR